MEERDRTPDRNAEPSPVEKRVPEQPDVPPRHAQDTQLVEGEDVLNPPPGSELIQKPKIQG